MENKKVFRISVRELVEQVLRSGDIDSGYAGVAKALEGTRVHKSIQKSRKEGYSAEVPVSYDYEDENLILKIDGRIDGVFERVDGVTIEEIKTTSTPLEYVDEDFNEVHWAQAKFYGYIYGNKNGLNNIEIQLTYFNREEKDTKVLPKNFTIDELKDFFFETVEKYLRWARWIVQWELIRDKSIVDMAFPFDSYRKGQREMAVAVYKTIAAEKKLFARAPTGTGKTMGVLFPAIKAMGEKKVSRIFYLTSRTTIGAAALKAVEVLRKRNLRIKSISLTAKEKICLSPGSRCCGEECQYAAGYYDHINSALDDILERDDITSDVVLEYAKKHSVCPFEFSLDISLFCDCIICDYNYLFDPRVYLKRFFMTRGDYTFLVDEAHNLVDRGRDMFSASLNKRDFLDLKKLFKGKNKSLYKVADEINTHFISIRKKCEEESSGYIVNKETPDELVLMLKEFADACEGYFEIERNREMMEKVRDIYFDVLNFIRTSESYHDGYITFVIKRGNDVEVKLFCLDPAKNLEEGFKRGKSAILFSATLNPIDYFYDLLGGCEGDYKTRIPSPFPPENLLVVLGDRISTKYKNREATYGEIVEMIYSMASSKIANYMVYFPSYDYMNKVMDEFKVKYSEVDTVCQKPDMTEEERKEFLDKFSVDNVNALVGYAVMGGIFGEGIDLVGERLSGVAIVGVGLPQICLERDLIKDYYNNKNNRGFEYSYVYPGMNRVLQAAGRVIRTENDRGVVLLIDERFSYNLYNRLLPDEWRFIKKVKTPQKLKENLLSFWNMC